LNSKAIKFNVFYSRIYMNEFRQTLSTVDIEDLALPFELATGRSGASATKQTMVTGLTKAFDRALRVSRKLSGQWTWNRRWLWKNTGSGYVYCEQHFAYRTMSFN
jgi:hypothetical protein